MNTEVAAQLIQILEKTVSPDQSELTAAQTFLEQAAQQNLAELLKTLSDILVHGGNSAVARRQAGLQLKNRLMSNDDAVRHVVQERWLQVRRNIMVARWIWQNG